MHVGQGRERAAELAPAANRLCLSALPLRLCLLSALLSRLVWARLYRFRLRLSRPRPLPPPLTRGGARRLERTGEFYLDSLGDRGARLIARAECRAPHSAALAVA